MDPILTQLPTIITYVALAVAAVIVVLLLVRKFAPAAPGRSLGFYEVIMRKMDGTIMRVKGTLIETNMFLNRDIAGDVKKVLVESLSRRIEAVGNSVDKTKNESELQKLKDDKQALEKADLSGVCRVVVTREGFSQKHVFIQYGHIGKSLDGYAMHEPRSKLTLSWGFLSSGVITGQGRTETKELRLPKIGRFKLHFFNPDIHGSARARRDEAATPEEVTKHLEKQLSGKGEEEQEIEPPEYLKTVALLVPASLELNEELKSKDEQLRDKDRKLIEMGHELSAAATERDGLRMAMDNLGIHDPQKLLASKKFDVIDLAVVSVPTLIGYFIVQSLGVIPIVGVFIGLLGGAGLVAFFRR